VKLSDAGITNLGVISRYGFHIQRTAPLEIFENEKPLALARYPNNVSRHIIRIPNTNMVIGNYAEICSSYYVFPFKTRRIHESSVMCTASDIPSEKESTDTQLSPTADRPVLNASCLENSTRIFNHFS